MLVSTSTWHGGGVAQIRAKVPQNTYSTCI